MTNHQRRVVPIVMYPFVQPKSLEHLHRLYSWLEEVVRRDKDHFAKPITVVNYQTPHRTELKDDFDRMRAFIEESGRSEIVDTWSVDTCQMWLAGFGYAYNKYKGNNCVYWLIPGDFRYNDEAGRKVLQRSEELPMVVSKDDADLCIGEISTEDEASKQLIDTYGTYGLLFIWFEAEARAFSELNIKKPRSEFFAINENYLKFVMLDKRWFAYEQTVVTLLYSMLGGNPVRKIRKVDLGKINDRFADRDTLPNAIQQIDRMERVLKTLWRETVDTDNTEWVSEYRKLDRESRGIRNSALVMLNNMLKKGG